MTRWAFVLWCLPIVIAPRAGVWHRSLGPVQLIAPAAFADPARYKVSSAVALSAGLQFYVAALVWLAWLALAIWISLTAAIVLLLLVVISSPKISQNWLAARYGLALYVAAADDEVLFWSGLLADQLGIDRGRARELLTGWIDWIANARERGRPASVGGTKGNPPPKK